MASEVYTTETIKLRDGTDVVLRPLAIGNLRKFMRIWNEYIEFLKDNAEKAKAGEDYLKEPDVADKQFDVFLELAVLSLEEELKGDKTKESYEAYISNTVDEATVYRVIDKCGGLTLNDPKLQEQALNLATAEASREDGTN